jgi:uronate dehydrogenase
MGNKLLLTGANGKLGSLLASYLSAQGFSLVLTDIQELSYGLPERAVFIKADLASADDVRSLVESVDAVIHFGGISIERPWEEILAANVIGTTHIFEAAREFGHRVVFASSNHTIGYYKRSQTIDIHQPYRPDGYYGLSKAYGELLGRMMFDKYGVESVNLRIGSAELAPSEARHVATWLSMDDLCAMVLAAITAKEVGFSIIWGVSKNQVLWWKGDDAKQIGFVSKSEGVAEGSLPEKGDAVARLYHGGSFTSQKRG